MDPFELPDPLPAGVAELDALRGQALAEVNVIRANVAANRPVSAEDRDYLRTLMSAIGTIDTARTAAATSDAEAQRDLDELLAQAEAANAPAEAPAADAPAEAVVAEAEAVVEEAAVEAQAEQEPVVAGAPARQVPQFAGVGAGAGSPTPADNPGNEPGWLMQPGAPNFREGMGRVGFREIALSLDSIRPGSRSAMRANRPNRKLDGVDYARQVVSSLPRDVPVVEDSHALVAAITEATKATNLTRPQFDEQTGSLTAAGGWCAPSEQLYTFCDVPDATDLISLPEITINRGGIRWPVEPDLSEIFENFEWFFTEPELEAIDPVTGLPTAVKTCVEVPCADEFEEIRLNAVGWCVEAGILQAQGWPELVEWFMRNLTQEHLRALSRRTILDMVAGSGTEIVVPAASTIGAASSALNTLALMATNLRLKRGLARTATIEGVAPSWFHEVLRADLAMQGGVSQFNVTDAQIDGWLRSRNIALQFVGDWQTRTNGKPGHLGTLSWPGTVNVLLYPAGTWFRSMSNVIELGVMYPKEQLQYNRFTRMFTEDAIAVGKRCGESINVKIPIDVSGAIGQREFVTANGSGNRVA